MYVFDAVLCMLMILELWCTEYFGFIVSLIIDISSLLGGGLFVQLLPIVKQITTKCLLELNNKHWPFTDVVVHA